MNNFSYIRANSAQEAVAALQGGRETQLVAGGTDLVPLMKEELVSPAALVDISAWKDGSRIQSRPDGLHIGALATLSAIAVHNEIGRSYVALGEACRLAATQQLRNMGSIGGNLLQQTRCWYYRGQHDCWLKGGSVCFARSGENEHHSILDTAPQVSPCVSAHPSDPAAALLALGARIAYLTPSGEAEMLVEELYKLPSEQSRSFTTLPANDVLTKIILPPASADSRSVYLKAMSRAEWSFALAGVAVYVELDGSRIREARVALSGVAPIPVRATEVEAQLVGSEVGSDFWELAEQLVKNAQPLAHNGYKVALLRGLFMQALNRVRE